jgi:hypothetical protein
MHEFAVFDAINEHLMKWTREISDLRVHGTTGERPAERFARDEAAALASVAGKAPFHQIREMVRVVSNDSFVDVDTNRYSVPWRLIGETLTVSVVNEAVHISFAGQDVATHPQCRDRHHFIRCPGHFEGIFREKLSSGDQKDGQDPCRPALLRSLTEYDDVIGGGW